jgi:N-acetylneuraminic acid mutarotase
LKGVDNPIGRHTSALTLGDDDFGTGNRGYGLVDDFIIQPGSLQKGIAYPQFGLGNEFQPSAGWAVVSAYGKKLRHQTSLVYNDTLYVIGGATSTGISGEVQFALIFPDGTLGPWASTTPLPSPRTLHQTVVHNGRVYVMGGWNGGAMNEVLFAPVLAGGNLGQWNETAPFPKARSEHRSGVYNGFLYVTGGYAGTEFLNDVQFSRINEDGTVGPWSSTTPFFTPRTGHTLSFHNGNIYVNGGYTDNAIYLNDVQYAGIRADGTTGNWNNATPFPDPRDAHVSFIYQDKYYVIGGATWPNFHNDVLFTKISADGSLEPWRRSTQLPRGMTYLSYAVWRGILYLLGGWNGTETYSEVIMTPLRPDGSTGEVWTKAGDMVGARYLHGAQIQNGHLYLIGGSGDDGVRSDVIFAEISRDGTLGHWKTAEPLPFPRGGHATVLNNGYLYVLGGYGTRGTLNDVWFSRIDEDGSLSPWTTTTGFPGARMGLAAAAYAGYMYLAGGSQFAQSFLGDLYYAPIKTDGSLGGWSQGTPLPTARSGHTATTYDGHVFIAGGRDGGGFLDEVLSAAILPDGSIGPWVVAGGFDTGRAEHAAMELNGFLYFAGGYNDSGYLSDIQHARLNADGTVGSWTASHQLDMGTAGHGMSAFENTIFLTGGYNIIGNSQEVFFAPVNTGESGNIPVSSLKCDYSKQLDTTRLSRFDLLTIDGTLRGKGGRVLVKMRVGDESGAYGSWSAPIEITQLPASLPIQTTAGRYMEVSLTIDDNTFAWPIQGDLTSVISKISVDAIPLKYDGESCIDPGDCLSGHCIGDSCCATECVPPGECQENPICPSGLCEYPAVGDGTTCGDDGNQCTEDLCQNGGCTHPLKATGTACDDGDQCTKGDVCDENGECSGQKYDCVPGTCEDSVTCDGNGGCTVVAYTAYPTPCLYDEPCTCGVCAGDERRCIQPHPCNGTACTDDRGPCWTQAGTCAAGACEHTFVSEAACDDGDPCTIDDKCAADTQTCKGKPSPACGTDGGADGGVPDAAPDDGGVPDGGDNDGENGTDVGQEDTGQPPDGGTPAVCTPGDRFCLDGDTAAICKEDGSAFFAVDCPPGQACTSGYCEGTVPDAGADVAEGTDTGTPDAEPEDAGAPDVSAVPEDAGLPDVPTPDAAPLEKSAPGCGCTERTI